MCVIKALATPLSAVKYGSCDTNTDIYFAAWGNTYVAVMGFICKLLHSAPHTQMTKIGQNKDKRSILNSKYVKSSLNRHDEMPVEFNNNRIHVSDI